MTFQAIIVIIVVGLCVAWVARRMFFKPKHGGCCSSKECSECCNKSDDERCK